LAALLNNHAELITEIMAIWIAIYRPQEIVQYDNKKEFKGALLILLH